MQYGVEISEFKRIGYSEKKKLSKIKEEPIKLISLFVVGILISRVIVFLNQDNVIGVAPFGIAYLLAIMVMEKEKSMISAVLGTTIGYLSISTSIHDKYINILSLIVLATYFVVQSKREKKIKELSTFVLVFTSYFLYGFIFGKYDLGINLSLSLVNTVVVVPIYYIIKYGINCIEEFNSNYFFSTEEIISMGILVCLIVSGIGSISIFQISLRTILSYIIILLVAFVGGAAYGSAIGVAMGVVVGINSGDMTLSIAFYSMTGLIAGIFKDTGRLFMLLAYCIMYFSLSLYSKSLEVTSIIEIMGAGLFFLIIPKSLFKRISVEINGDEKRNEINEKELVEIKKEFTDKVDGLNDALISVSKTLKSLGINESLMYKDKSSALIENLADRICSDCSRCNKCWGQEFNLTYNSIQRLIESCESGRIVFPSHLEKVCERKYKLIKASENIVDTMNNNQAMKERLQSGRLILADHIMNITNSMDEMIGDFKKDVSLCGDLERIIRHGLNKNSIKYNNVFCYMDSNGREKVKITMNNCEGGKYCYKNILPIISDLLRKPMTVDGDGCRINPDSNECNIVFVEAPKYNVLSYAAISIKDGEEYTGDTYSFGKTKNGCYMTLLSDGMGSGPEASKESKATVDVVEKFIEAGFGKQTAINMVNSIMSMKFEEDEKFSTLDLNVVDLYSGEASFMKVGAVASFIKRKDKVIPIVSNMPPFGLVDKVDINEVKIDIKNGDVIVLISDGIIDVNKESVGQYNWIEEFLKSSTKDPKELAGDILEKAKELSGGKSPDDMTVVVSKVSKMYA